LNSNRRGIDDGSVATDAPVMKPGVETFKKASDAGLVRLLRLRRPE